MLKENREAAFHSKMMATIDHDAPVEIDLPACSIHAYDRDRVLELFRELEFRSFADRLPESDGALHKRLQADRRPPATYDLVRTAAALRSWIERARKAPLVAVDLETSGQDTISARIAGYALAVAPGEAMYVPVEHAADGEPMLSPAEAKSLLQPLLEEPTVPKVLHNAKFDMKVLARHGVTLRGLQEDTMIAAYLPPGRLVDRPEGADAGVPGRGDDADHGADRDGQGATVDGGGARRRRRALRRSRRGYDPPPPRRLCRVASRRSPCSRSCTARWNCR